MTGRKINLAQAEDFLINLIPRAGQILRRFFHAETLPKKKKGKLDFVTAADLAVDEFLKEVLKKEYPQIPILSEETAPVNLSSFAREDLLWVVDPLDGTANFARGDANFSISIALVEKGKPLVGIIFAPVASRLFWAREDKEGAFWNGRRLTVSATDNLESAILCTDWSHLLETRDQTTTFLRQVYGRVRKIKILGSAATDLTLLSRGGIDIYHHVYVYPWDVSAAALIIQKAGGVVTDTDGGKWNVFTPGILTANPILHRKMLDLLS